MARLNFGQKNFEKVGGGGGGGGGGVDISTHSNGITALHSNMARAGKVMKPLGKDIK